MTEEIVAGRNAVFEALSSRRPVNKIFIKAGLQGGSLGKIIAAAQSAAVPVEYVQSEKLDRLAPGIRHQGIVALASPIGRIAGSAERRCPDPQRGRCRGTRCFIAQAAKLPPEHGCGKDFGRSC